MVIRRAACRTDSGTASAGASGASQRRPGLWDRVVLSAGTPTTRGLQPGVVATVIKLQ